MDIDPKKVMQLRAATGLGMMTCKKALVAEGGHYEKAMDRLRKEGLKAADKKAGRATGEGLVRGRIAEDGSRGTMIAVLCETEPVSNTPQFTEFVDALVDHVEEHGSADADTLLAQPWIKNAQETVRDALNGLIARLGENMRIERVERLDAGENAIVAGYVHFTKKIGALVALEASPLPDDLGTFARELCKHVVVNKPTALLRAEISDEVRQKELEIYRAQLDQDPKMASKPAQVREKILEGKMDAFYRQAVLTEQPWFMDDSQTVGQMLEKQGATVRSFHLFQVGA